MSGLRSVPSMPNMADRKIEKVYPTRPEDYELQDECGRGMSATVWKAICKPLGEVVAVKLLDLESLNVRIEEIVKEAQTMKLAQHPNILPLLCSFVESGTGRLWMVEPYVSGGSALNIMKYAYPFGLEESMIAYIGREVLRGMEYMHKNGMIHRDVKAGNILIDGNGHVMLADFGVAATLERTATWGQGYGNRGTFVGTPCWMAPEVLEKGSDGAGGYNSAADIWSFGITLFELAHGHAPFAKFPPLKVFMMILQQEPPSLDSEGDPNKKFSKLIREVVKMCLQKAPEDRPSASKLLEHKFFKTTHDQSTVRRHLLDGLPTLPDRVKALRTGSAPSAHNCEQSRAQAAESRNQYVAGVSAWNFDLAEIKRQADAMDEIQEGDEDEHFDSEGEGSLREAHHAAPTNGSAAASTAHAAAAPDLHHHHTTRVDTPPAPAPAKPPSLLVPQDSFDAHAGNGSRGLVSAASLPAPESMRCKEPIKRGRFEISDQDEDGGSPPSAQNVTSPSSADLSDTAGPAPASAAPYRPTQSVPNLHVDLSSNPEMLHPDLGSHPTHETFNGLLTQRQTVDRGRFQITDEDDSPSPPQFIDRKMAAVGKPPLSGTPLSLPVNAMAPGASSVTNRAQSQGPPSASSTLPSPGGFPTPKPAAAQPPPVVVVQQAAQILLPDLEVVQKQISEAQLLLTRLCRTVVEVERTGVIPPAAAARLAPATPALARSSSREGSRSGSPGPSGVMSPPLPGVGSAAGSVAGGTASPPDRRRRSSASGHMQSLDDVQHENEALRRRVAQLEQLLAKNNIRF